MPNLVSQSVCPSLNYDFWREIKIILLKLGYSEIRIRKITHTYITREFHLNANNTPMGMRRTVSDVRAEIGSLKYDEYVRTLFTLYDKTIDPRTEYMNQTWVRFERIFSLVGMI